MNTVRRGRKKRPRGNIDVVQTLFEVERLLRSHQQALAITCLFRASTAVELPAVWRHALKSLTRQVRRVASHEQQAIAALRAGRKDQARRRLRLAEDILAAVPSGLTIEFRGGSITGHLDLAGLVVKAARDMLAGTRGLILNISIPTIGPL
jgi:hypothetical protein